VCKTDAGPAELSATWEFDPDESGAAVAASKLA